MASLKHSQYRAVTKLYGYASIKLVEIEIKLYKGWHVDTYGKDGSLWSSPLRLLKLTSSTTMLLPSNNSVGSLPESELHDRLRLNKLVMPSHMQQFVSFCHEVVSP
ncbi:hypothetical protein PR202_gb06260 [Eleusine coracana subsp. coracana]|uniref:Uncharacterized protein n=1 Tax=Eleusine coracana subsp. coracana TaxID=191504 RepID=A0AAV5E7E2_ELECO|nr:hypothetical protein PR202_gb06260 [Eleusine coracana subsp. coracana]